MDKNERHTEDWLDWLEDSDAGGKEDDMKAGPEDEALRELRQMVHDCNRAFARKHHAAPDVDRAWENFKAGHVTMRNRRKDVLLWSGWAGLAACLAWLVWIYIPGPDVEKARPEVVFAAVHETQDVTLSGEDGAVWTLDDQRAGQTLGQHGIRVERRAVDYREAEQVKQQTLTVPRGRDCHLTLADGTEVWVNAGSELRFPSRFVGKERVVSLKGEAYFKVAGDKDCPFIVQTDRFNTRVYGTEFNLKVYPGDLSSLTLVEGAVAVGSPSMTDPVRLVPGQELSMDAAGKVTLQRVDTYACRQWKEGFFYIDRAPLKEVLCELGRWYNVDIESDCDPALLDKHIHFVAGRRDGLSEALDKLNDLQIVQAAFEGGRIVLR